MRGGRSKLVVLAVLVGGLLAGLAGAAWYALGEERRTGRLVGSYLAGRTGLLITVDRARVAGGRLILTGVRVRPSGALPVGANVPRLDIEGALLPVVFPAGGAVVVRADAASVSIDAVGPGGAPDARTLAALTTAARSWLASPGTLALRAPTVELRLGGRAYWLEVAGDKTATGELILSLGLGPERGTSAATLDVRAVADGDADLALKVEGTGQPNRLGMSWPPSVPPSVAVSADAGILSGGELTADARIVVGGSPPFASISLGARYDGREGRLLVSRFGVDGLPGIALQGSGAIERAEAGFRLAVDATGTIDRSPLVLRGSFSPGSRLFDGDLRLSDVNIDDLCRRYVGRDPGSSATAGTLRAKIHGGADGVVTLEASVTRLELVALPRQSVDVTLAARVDVVRAQGGPTIESLRSLTLGVFRGGASFVTVTGRSHGGGLFPIRVEALASDLAFIGPVLAADVELTGTARLEGEIRSGERLGLVGRAQVEVPRAAAQGGKVSVSTLRADLPVAWNVNQTEEPGQATLDRLTAWGFHVDALRSNATFRDGQVLLPDVRAAHHGGRAEGWLEIAVDGREVPVRSHLEGDRIDLAAIVRESRSDLARITGRVRYVLNAQYARAAGLVGTLDFESQEDGEVAIEPIRQLLLSPTVEVESSGLLRQTLENLRVFEYEWLKGVVRMRGGSSRADLTLRGKKRMWIFPGPVEAINLKNVPLDLLVRTLEKGPSP
jgi:hypothetical protein